MLRETAATQGCTHPVPHLQEPFKAEQLAFERDGKYPTRMASVTMTKPPKSYPIEMELNLEEGSVVSYKTVSTSLPCITRKRMCCLTHRAEVLVSGASPLKPLPKWTVAMSDSLHRQYSPLLTIITTDRWKGCKLQSSTMTSMRSARRCSSLTRSCRRSAKTLASMTWTRWQSTPGQVRFHFLPATACIITDLFQSIARLSR